MICEFRFLMKEMPLIKNRLNFGIKEKELLENSSINWKQKGLSLRRKWQS